MLEYASDNLRGSALIKTYGLNPSWALALDIFEKNNTLNNFLLVIDLFQIQRKINCLGSLLKFLSSPQNNLLLQKWATENLHAKALLSLSYVVIHNRAELLRKYKPLPDEQSASRQLHGELSSHYLLALLLERLPPSDKLSRAWFEGFKLWIFIQALSRASLNNFQDENLRFVSDKTRLGADKLGDWYKLICLLKPTGDEFSLITSYLIYCSDRLLKKDKDLNSSNRLFLKNIISVAKGEQKPDKRSGNLSALSTVGLPDDSFTLVKPEIENIPLDVGAITGELPEDETLFSIKVNQESSLNRQKLSAQSVILNSIIQSQYLPFDWDCLSKYEFDTLNYVNSELLNSELEQNKLLGAFVWISLRTSRSIRRACEISIGHSPHLEWTLSEDCKYLYRLPPSRKSDWRPKSEEESSWLYPNADFIKINIPSEVVGIIKSRISQFKEAKTIGQLWSSSWSYPETYFNQYISSKLPRVTSNMLASALPNQFYQMTHDDALTQLIASHPQSGLSASCAYANWKYSSCNIPNLVALSADDASLSLHKDLILFGSQLDVIEQTLINAITQWNANYEAYIAHAKFIERHNAFVSYLVFMLFAASGVRPIRDPFESILHFDFENCFVYVNDKNINQDGGGRLVPLPKNLCNYIQTVYLAHLDYLSRSLQTVNPIICEEIRLTLVRRPSGKLPFLFFLSDEEGLDWESISMSSIQELGIFDCPLPTNFFRHRLAKDLRQRGLQPEIIAGILGHADAGSEIYGDFSNRIWMADAVQARGVITASFNSLAFELKSFNSIGLVTSNLKLKSEADFSVVFGERARLQTRSRHLKETIKIAKFEIAQFLAGKELSQLDEKEFELISKKMLFHDNGIPRSNGYVRYEYLILKAEQLWKKTGKKVKVTRRYSNVRAKSIFSPDAPTSFEGLGNLKSAIIEILEKIQPSKLSLEDCICLAIFLILLESRFADYKATVNFLLSKSFRLTQVQGNYYFEIPNKENFDLYTPFRRIKISNACAYLLSRLLSARYTLKIPLDIPVFLDSLYKAVRTFDATTEFKTFLDLIRVTSHFVDQQNCLTLEGVLAGYLAGRVESYSLGIFDWVKIKTGKQVQLPEATLVPGDTKQVALDLLPIVKVEQNSAQNNKPFDINNARDFYQALRKLLHDYRATKKDGDKSRANLQSQVTATIKKHRQLVSSAVLILGHWVEYLLSVKITQNRHLKISSVERYFAALSSYFIDIAFDKDIYLMDSEDVTQLYLEILNASSLMSRAYVGNRLIQFDEFATQYGVESPDWHELPLEKNASKVSPGIISSDEYHRALHIILKNSFNLEVSNVALCMLLMLCYRFGLRAKEALGLLQTDWQENDGKIIVLVQNNRIRTLKNVGSRRQVPLLFNLLKVEYEIIDRHKAELNAVFGLDKHTPFFQTQRQSLTDLQMKNMQTALSKVLKMVTGNTAISLHHSRHSAANKVGLAAFNLKLDGWKGRGFTSCGNQNEMILGSNSVTRRSTWAMARYLGHVVRDTQFRNYLHFLSDWAELAYEPLNIEFPLPVKATIFDLDALPELKPVDYNLIAKLSSKPTPINALVILKYCRLLSLGKDEHVAGASLNLKQTDVGLINDSLKKLLDNVTVANKKVTHVEFLQSIKKPSWDRFLDYLESDLENINKKSVSYPQGSLQLITDDLGLMVGSTRQILLWKETHFDLFNTFINAFSIQLNSIQFISSNRIDERLLNRAKALGFNLVAQSKASRGNASYQLDAIRQNGMLVESKIAVVCVKNSHHLIRSGSDLILLFAFYIILLLNDKP